MTGVQSKWETARPAGGESRARILIVEDEPTLGKQLKSTLEGAGYAVDLSTDGEDGHYADDEEESVDDDWE